MYIPLLILYAIAQTAYSAANIKTSATPITHGYNSGNFFRSFQEINWCPTLKPVNKFTISNEDLPGAIIGAASYGQKNSLPIWLLAVDDWQSIFSKKTSAQIATSWSYGNMHGIIKKLHDKKDSASQLKQAQLKFLNGLYTHNVNADGENEMKDALVILKAHDNEHHPDGLTDFINDAQDLIKNINTNQSKNKLRN